MALILTPVYFIIAALHLFIVPGFHEDQANARKTVYKQNIQLTYYLVRNDRSTFSESKNGKSIQKRRPPTGNALLINTPPLLNVLKYNSFLAKLPCDSHHSWLSNRILRI